MIKEEPRFVLIFHNMTEVLEARECIEKQNIDVELIPLPGKVEHGCGTAIKADPKDREAILAALEAAGIQPCEDKIINIDA